MKPSVTHILIPVLSAPLLCGSPPGTFELQRESIILPWWTMRTSKRIKDSKNKLRQVYQEQTRTSVGNLFPLLQSIPTLKTKRQVRRSKLNLMRRELYSLVSRMHKLLDVKIQDNMSGIRAFVKSACLMTKASMAEHLKVRLNWTQVCSPFIFTTAASWGCCTWFDFKLFGW